QLRKKRRRYKTDGLPILRQTLPRALPATQNGKDRPARANRAVERSQERCPVRNIPSARAPETRSNRLVARRPRRSSPCAFQGFARDRQASARFEPAQCGAARDVPSAGLLLGSVAGIG